jgi:phosphoribosyl 1,2-cyclic phosphate phosphodiesterase
MTMKLTFLGTAAAQGYPDPFCACAHCARARVLGGPSIRRRAAAILNDDLLFDFGPDLVSSSASLGVPLTNVRYVLVTHFHSDHFDPSNFLIRSRDYGVPTPPTLEVYATDFTLRRGSTTFVRDLGGYELFTSEAAKDLDLAYRSISPFEPFNAGPYRVIAFPAAHDEGAVVWSVTRDGRTILYATDTKNLPEATWRGFVEHKLRFDVAVFDHTYGDVDDIRDHLTAREVAAHATRLRSEGLLADGGRVFGTHISHESAPPHPELREIAARLGYEIAFDGLTV